jgi:MFS transporter, MHS family, shikimate and dehydroshikimate transport protein
LLPTPQDIRDDAAQVTGAPKMAEGGGDEKGSGSRPPVFIGYALQDTAVAVPIPAGRIRGQGASIRRVAFASFIGTAIEWYDFYIYGTAAALVFPKLFFPQFSALTGTLASFATFGVAFLARPIGGIIFGHFGDRIGRKSMLVITLLLMGGATFLVGLLPTFERIGVLAPILLAVLRFVQGFAVGGEWGGAALMTIEHAPEERRHFYASWPQVGSPAGLILSTVVFGAFSSLPDAYFFAWGWRVPFLLSIVLIAVGLFIRLRILESPVFARVKQLGAESRLPMREIMRDYRVATLLAIGVVLIVYNYIVTTFTPSYATRQLGVARNVPLIGLMIGGVAQTAGILVLSRVADRVGTRAVAISSAMCALLFCYPYFWLVDTRHPALIWFAMGTWLFFNGAYYGILGVFLAELFPVRLRYSGISFSFQVAGVLGGGLAPIIATILIQWSGGASWPVATYLSVVALVSLVAVYLASDRYRVKIAL